MFKDPTARPPFRVMIFGACRETWYSASDNERQDQALPALRGVLNLWVNNGLHLLETFDDDYFLVGQPGSLQFSFFILAEVPSLESLVWMMNQARKTQNGYRADTYFRFESRLGRRLFMVDQLDSPPSANGNRNAPDQQPNN